MSRTARANLMLLLAAVLWGGGFVAGKMALTGAAPFVILTWRFMISALVTFLLFARRIRRTPKRTALSGAAVGAIQMTALAVQLTGLQYTTSAKQSFLCTAYVAMTPFVSWLLLKKRPGIPAVLGGGLALLGIGLISLERDLSVNIGDGMSLGFAVMFALQIVLVGKFVAQETDSIQLTFFQFLSAAALALLICLLRGETLAVRGTEALMGLAYIAIPNTCIAFLLQNAAQKDTKDVVASLIMSLESVFGFAFSLLYYGEAVTWWLLLGGGLCFAAILLNTVKIHPKKVEV